MKHKEIAKAWLDGEKVQKRDKRVGEWVDLVDPNSLDCCYTFKDEDEYRIKPEVVYTYTLFSKCADGRVVATGTFDFITNALDSRPVGVSPLFVFVTGSDGSVDKYDIRLDSDGCTTVIPIEMRG